MSELDPARREELAEALSPSWLRRGMSRGYVAVTLAPLIARWLADARAEGAAEVRARVEAAEARISAVVERAALLLCERHQSASPTRQPCAACSQDAAALADPTEETP